MQIYQRHIPLYSKDEFRKIQNTTVAVLGCGGLGSTVLQLLCRMGVGTIHFWDPAVLDEPDLNRQMLYNQTHLGRKKAEIAKEVLHEINPTIQLYAYTSAIGVDSKIPRVDLAFDCLDTFSARLNLDQLFFSKDIPVIHASVFEDMGQLTSFVPGKTENYRNTFGIDSDSKEMQSKTVFPPIVTTMASLQVNEAIKYITGKQEQMLLNKLLVIHLGKNQFDLIPLT